MVGIHEPLHESICLWDLQPNTDLNWHVQLLRIGNYEHFTNYLDNENKSLPDCVQVVIAENETLALTGLIRG